MGFQKAVKSQSKLRAAFFGPSGAGKTYTALSVASGMGAKIALIDSERGSASKYADRFDFDVVNLEGKAIDDYVAFIKEASGYDVLIIDSLSHAWQDLLEEIDKLANAKYKGNTWSAWSEGTPKQRKLVDAILTYPGHIIATMRSKTEWQTEQNNGKSRPVRVGLAPEQGKGIEYEFDLLLELSTDHIANVIKDRTGKFQDTLLDKPGKEFGQQLVAWLGSGESVKPTPAQVWSGLASELVALNLSEEVKAKYRDRVEAAKKTHDIEALRGIIADAKKPETPLEKIGAGIAAAVAEEPQQAEIF